jgi:hypothetical protein
LQNVKEHATPLAGAGVETGVEVHDTDDSADNAASGGCSASPCSASSIGSEEAEAIIRDYMVGLADLIKPGPSEKLVLGDLKVACQRSHELIHCDLGEVLSAWSQETPDNVNLGWLQRAIPLLVLLWRLSHGFDRCDHGIDRSGGEPGLLHGVAQEVNSPEVVEFWNHLLQFLPNANVDLPDTAAQDSASKPNNPAVSG